MSHAQSLAENRYQSKRYAVSREKGHLFRMAAKVKEPKTPLQALFLKRVQEEMDKRGLSRAGLSGRTGGPSQTTFNDTMRGSDPRLETVYEIATALGIQAWQLLRESADVERENVTNVKNFPQPGRMIRKSPKSARKKADDRTKTGG